MEEAVHAVMMIMKMMRDEKVVILIIPHVLYSEKVTYFETDLFFSILLLLLLLSLRFTLCTLL